MAAVMVLYFREAGVQRGDTIAAGVSGSFPGMNLAMYAAADAVGVVPVVITSLGASSWGANNPRFTWLHMEATLKEVGLLERGSVAASLGGGEDMGRQLSPGGREMLRESARRNGVPLIEEPLLEQAVHRRMVVYDSVAGRAAYELYANIGGGLASIGHSRNTQILEEGLHDRLPILNYPRRGVIHAFSDRDVPVLNIYNIVQIADAFDLPRTPNPLPQPGQGRLFAEERYSMLVTSVALLVVLATLIVVLLFDRRAQQLNRPGVDPDTLM
jgi:poly-gamma-glutamate system protein